MARLDGRVAIVTGAARGIGRAFALGLAEQGADLAVVDLADASGVGREITGRLHSKAHLIEADVSLEDDVSRAVASVIDAFGRVDILVNNAAYFASIPIVHHTELPTEVWINKPINTSDVIVPSEILFAQPGPQEVLGPIPDTILAH